METVGNKQLPRIKGWLALQRLGLVLTIPFFPYMAITAPMMHGKIINWLMEILVILIAIPFFKRKKITPKLMIGFYILLVAYSICEMKYGINGWSEEIPEYFIGSIFSVCVWVPYFLFSKHVKKTFIN